MIGFLASSAVIVGHMYVRLSVLERIITSLAALGMFWPSLLFQIVGTVIFVAPSSASVPDLPSPSSPKSPLPSKGSQK